ncbi:MAG: apolipoprotein N-acyltransferase, partial [Candidatus Acidiferrales bacterium]
MKRFKNAERNHKAFFSTLPVLSPARNPTACALLTGLLLVLALPRAQLTLLGFVALVPLLAALTYPRSRFRAFWLGYLAGLVFFAGTCYWIQPVMRQFGRLSELTAAAVLLLLTVVFALFFGLFSFIVGELARRWQFLALAAAPFAWVAIEWLRTYIFFEGFPWNLLGYAVAPHIGWIQHAAYVGVYGVSFLLAAVCALVAGYWRAPSPRGAVALAIVAATLLATDFWGRRLPPVVADSDAILIQTNLPQQDDFDPLWVYKNTAELDQLDSLTIQSARLQNSPSPPLILWPEVPVSFYFHHDATIRDRFLHLAQATRSYLLVGIVDFRSGDDGKSHALNSAVLLSPRGEFIGQYDKIHLVPFGEYVPVWAFPSLVGKITHEAGNFVPGASYRA